MPTARDATITTCWNHMKGRVMDAGYRLLEHTADVGLTVWAPDPARAFVQAARGMFAIILGGEPEHVGAGLPAERELEITGRDWPQLLVNWLAELLFHFEVETFVPQQVTMRACAPPRCAARIKGIRLTGPESARGVGVKAVTYHQLAVDVRPERTDLRVVFDI